MSNKRKIKASEVAADLRAGLDDDAIMKKYAIAEKSLRKIIRKLLDAGVLSPEEVADRAPLEDTLTHIPEYMRDHQRHHVLMPVPIYDMDDLIAEGYITDISEGGVRVNGITAQVGETKSLLIQADEFADVFPFNFDAKCRWAQPETSESASDAGFEIVGITDGGRNELKKLIRVLAFSE